MQVIRLSKLKLTDAYGIFCAAIPGNQAREGLYPTQCRVPVKGKTTAHSHYESEVFVITQGKGIMTVDGESRLVEAGDFIRIPAFSRHELTNQGETHLEFLSLYSEDFSVPSLPTQAIVTTAPPTPNGPMHLGHVSGPYLASDVVSRYLKLRSVNVRTHSGTDDHQNYVVERAYVLRQSPEDFRAEMRSRIESGMEAIGIRPDEWIEPKKDLTYQTHVIEFSQRALSAGVVDSVFVDFPYCGGCNLFLVDALISGQCPACGGESRGGCESCGIVVTPMELSSPHCGRCAKPAHALRTRVLQFDLARYLPLILGELEAINLSPRIRRMIKAVSEKKSFQVLLTHPHGPEVNSALTEPTSGQAIHVWFEMAAHYEKFAKGERDWIHCFGFDNSFHYLLFIPTLLRAIDADAKLPFAVIANEFLLLNGAKFSTRRNHAIWADEFVGNLDHLRLYLNIQRPAPRAANFSALDFTQFSAELSSLLAQVHSRVTNISFSDEVAADALVASNRLTRDLESLLHPKQLDLRQVGRRLLAWIDYCLQSEGNEKLTLWCLAMHLAPIMPKESELLYQALEKVLDRKLGRGWIDDWAKVL